MWPWSWFGRASCGFGRQLVVALSIATYVATCVGLPFPSHVSKRSGERFPCENHACGCATARECWESCCCYTPRQKLAWAKAHGVTPPTYVVAQVEREQPRACCQAHAEQGQAACCKARKHEHDHEPAAGKHTTRIVWLIGTLTRQCKGMTDFWTSCPPSLPPVVLAVEYVDLGWTPHANFDGILPLARCNSPPVPPPEASLSC